MNTNTRETIKYIKTARFRKAANLGPPKGTMQIGY